MAQNYFAHQTAVIDDGASVGRDCKIWHFSHLMPGCVVGNECVIGQNVMIASEVRLGTGVKVQNNVSLYTGVECEDDVFIGPSAVFTNVINPRSAVNRKNQFRKTIVHRGATIGANATIICGVTIGEYAFVGAGSVVTESVRAFALVVGNPALQIGWMSRNAHRLEFDFNSQARCPETGECYQLTAQGVVLVEE